MIDIPLSSVQEERTNFENNCFTLDLSFHVNVTEFGLKQIFFYFKMLKDTGVFLSIEDKRLSAHRDIKFNKHYFSGDHVEIEDLGNKFISFILLGV